MKSKLFSLVILVALLICSCNRAQVNVEILSPKDGDTFSMYEDIKVTVDVNTEKGLITMVTLEIEFDTIVFKAVRKPYSFTIPRGTFRKVGNHYLCVTATSSKDEQGSDSIDIIITE
jgi:hypothetical protein